MAKYLPFRRIHEDEHRVECTFGSPEMNRRLVIDKASPAGTPRDGTADQDYAAVLVKIPRFRDGSTRFPESGAFAA
jgi:hypothetical protein